MERRSTFLILRYQIHVNCIEKKKLQNVAARKTTIGRGNKITATIFLWKSVANSQSEAGWGGRRLLILLQGEQQIKVKTVHIWHIEGESLQAQIPPHLHTHSFVIHSHHRPETSGYSEKRFLISLWTAHYFVDSTSSAAYNVKRARG